MALGGERRETPRQAKIKDKIGGDWELEGEKLME